MRYKVDSMAEEDAYFVTFYLGFRIEPRMGLLFRRVVEDMLREGEVTVNCRYQAPGSDQRRVLGDFQFVLFRSFLSYDNELPTGQQLVMNTYFALKNVALPPQEAYGLDSSNVLVEAVPVLLAPPTDIRLVRIPAKTEQSSV